MPERFRSSSPGRPARGRAAPPGAACALAALSGGACALAVVAATTPARADPPRPKTYALGWVRLDGAERCIGQRELAASVEGVLGRRAFAPAAQAELTVEGRVGPRPGGFRATLQLSDPRGALLSRRDLSVDGPNCRALDEKLKLALALLVSPGAEAKPSSAEWADVEPDPWEGLPAGLSEPDPWEDLPASPEPDPWYQLPPRASARATASRHGRGARAGGGEREGAEISAFVGYGTGSDVVPLEGVSTGAGLGLGLGVRGGYGFASGLWLGASYTHYAGGSFQAEGPVLGGGGRSSETVGGRFAAHAPALEVGYSVPVGPLRLRPQVGVGAIYYAFRRDRAADRAGGEVLLPDAIARSGSQSTFVAWPGVALLLPLGEAFFAAEARLGLVAGADSASPLSLFGAGGVRF
ncbi:MAG TPA: hypothetical protein VFS43_33025 [Polyangiaceae bacterium]|nr:hypothetical protein [Polyangiaceae bacterium]